jgi:dihydrofolate reductase
MLGAIWAANEEGVIGDGNDLLWHIPEDLTFFKQVTLDSTIIMGRKTWESLPYKPLRGRENVVISRGGLALPEGVKLAQTVAEAVSMASQPTQWVIGGGQIYELALPLCAVVEQTLVKKQVNTNTPVYAPSLDGFALMDETEWFLSTKENIEYKHQTWVAERLLQ